MNRLAPLLAALVALVAAGAAPAKGPPVDSCVPKALRGGAVSFRATDGVRVSGLLMGSGAKGIVLAHELNANLCNWLPFAQTLARSGYRVLAIDSRNAGVSQHDVVYPRLGHFERDLLGAERELRRRGAERLAFAGASAGATAAMAAAPSGGRALAAVVVLSGVTKYLAMDAEAAAKRVTAPSFFAVGANDSRFVPEVQKLYDVSAATQKQLEIVDGSFAHGTELLAGAEGAPMRTKLLAFLAEAFRE